MTNNKAYEHCVTYINDARISKYVKKQMRIFMNMCEDKDEKYIISVPKVNFLENVCKKLIDPNSVADRTVYDRLVGYQWLFLTAINCAVYREDPKRFRYTNVLLEEGRRNGKTFLVAIQYAIRLLMAPVNAELFIMSMTKEHAEKILNQVILLLQSSPEIWYKPDGTPRFKHIKTTKRLVCLSTNATIRLLAHRANAMDGNETYSWIIDEVGAMRSSEGILSMKKGTLALDIDPKETAIQSKSPLGILISTKYGLPGNAFEGQVSYCKRMLDGLFECESYFALLYEPDHSEGWETDDLILYQANPLMLAFPKFLENKKKARAEALEARGPDQEKAISEFCLKDCNIIRQCFEYGQFVTLEELRECQVNEINWSEMEFVTFGIDLSKVDDNSGVAMVGVDKNKHVYYQGICYVPGDEYRIEVKTNREHVPYSYYIRQGLVKQSSFKAIDPMEVFNETITMSEEYKVSPLFVCYDPYNTKTVKHAIDNFALDTLAVPQRSMTLSPIIKFFKQLILNKKFHYLENDTFFELNIQNIYCQSDAQMNVLFDKRKSYGKIDMAAALIDALYGLDQKGCFITGDRAEYFSVATATRKR